MGLRVHMQERSYREVLFDSLSLLSMGGEKNLEGMGEAAVHGANSLHAREDNIMPVVNGLNPLTGLCGSMVYL